MLGYEVMIWRALDASQTRAIDRCVAPWKTGSGGLKWLDDLTRTGEVEDHGGGGYPLHYRIRAGALVKALANGLPANNSPLVIGSDSVFSAGYNEMLSLDASRLRACADDEWLIVEAWDQS